jgi:hypothetical protein
MTERITSVVLNLSYPRTTQALIPSMMLSTGPRLTKLSWRDGPEKGREILGWLGSPGWRELFGELATAQFRYQAPVKMGEICGAFCGIFSWRLPKPWISRFLGGFGKKGSNMSRGFPFPCGA